MSASRQPNNDKSPATKPGGGTKPAGAVPAGPLLRALPNRIVPFLDELLRRPLARWLGPLGLVIALALLLGPSFQKSDPLWKKLQVGQRADTNIKATRDFRYLPSEEEAERQRNRAAVRVLPVFDHRADLAAELLSRINRAFDMMSRPASTSQTAGGAGGREAARPATRAATLSARDRFAAELGVKVSKKTFGRLREAKFSLAVRAAVILLVGSTMDELIMPDRGVLRTFEDEPIIVRHLVNGQLGRDGEEKVTNFNRIQGLDQVRGAIRHRATIHGANLSATKRRAVASLVEALVVPNLKFNPNETNKRKAIAREGAASRPLPFVKGQIVIRDGDAIKSKDIRVLRAMEGSPGRENIARVLIGIGGFLFLMLVSLYRLAVDQFRRFVRRPRDLVMMGLLLFSLLVLARSVMAISGVRGAEALHLQLFPYFVPIAAGAMLVRLLVSVEASVLFSFVAAASCGLLFDSSLELTLFYLLTSVVGAHGVKEVQSRGALLQAGLASGLLGAGAVLGLSLFAGQVVLGDTLLRMSAAVGGGVLAAFVTLALLPAVEWLFAYTTDITLLELANLNHPLLRDLMLRAPGTYHHSMVVGSLAEAACEAIGANGLLARVASNYHDVGKMKNATYFAENMRSGDNPHNRLKPSMSGLIIRNHVKDGIEMMRQHGIPEFVINTASQHHGTALIAFFYHKAVEQKEPDEEISEEDYRYPGPKPQSREAGVLMLADSVEAAARSLAEPTVDRVRALVQRVINTLFTDGQLNHCDLTLRDLHDIARSFLQVLRGIYHARPTYPWQRAEESRREGGVGKDKESTEAEKGALGTGAARAANPSEGAGLRKEPSDGGGGVVRGRAGKGSTPGSCVAPDQGRGSEGGGPPGAKEASASGPGDGEPSPPDLRRLGCG